MRSSAPVPAYNPFLDLHDYTRRILAAKRLGIFTIGGGVPRNWAQQVGPFIEMINMRLGSGSCPCRGSTTPCGSVPSRSTGAG